MQNPHIVAPRTPAWIGQCVMTDGRNPRPVPNTENAYIGIANDLYADRIAFDEMLGLFVMESSPCRPLTDNDIVGIQCWLQRCGLKYVGHKATRDAVHRHGLTRAFHPVRDYLNQLKHDGETRLARWLHECLGVEDSAYSAEIGAMFLVSMVARILRPGVKVDHMLVIEGPQGKLKSTACRVLAGDEYFSDSLPEISVNTKDVSMHLRGKWLIEIAEMHAISKVESNQLKQFLTRTTERYRPPYGSEEVMQHRQCVFIGTSNQDTYLKDETGGRRFWPVKAGEINIGLLTQWRDQLFAEAVVAFRAGMPWWPTREFETAHIKPQQEARFQEDVWMEVLREKLAHEFRTTIRDAAWMIGLPVDRIGAADQRRISACLTHLGFRPRRSNRARWWEREREAGDSGDAGDGVTSIAL